MESAVSIQVNNVSKIFNEKKGDKKSGVLALNQVSFEVNKGDIFGLIGPDGAGKTTLFRILSTLLLPSNGNVSVDGLDIASDYMALRKKIGYMPGRFSLYTDLSVIENLHFFATLFQTSVQANYDLIRDIYVQLKPFAHRRAGALSGGMKQKLALCCALIHKPSILLLDEPTTGVDPVSRKEFWDILSRLREMEMTIVVSTPYMDEAKCCNKLAFMQQGEILTQGDPTALEQAFTQPLWSIKDGNMHQLLSLVRQYKGVAQCFSFGDSLHLWFKPEMESIADLQQFLKKNGVVNLHCQQIDPSIEDYFIKLSVEVENKK